MRLHKGYNCKSVSLDLSTYSDSDTDLREFKQDAREIFDVLINIAPGGTLDELIRLLKKYEKENMGGDHESM